MSLLIGATVQPNPIEKCDQAIDLVEQGLASKEEVMQAMAFKQKLGEIYRALSHRFDQAAIAWIEQNGEIEEGEKRWYVGTVTNRKCRNVNETVRTILESEGPDGLVRCLSTNCFRAATAMQTLGEKASDHFDTTTTKEVNTGKPKKALKGARVLPDGKPVDDEE